MKCNFTECKNKLNLIEECKFCENKFCLSHRLVETHHCSNIDLCIQQAVSKNINVLLKDKCTSTKINVI